MPAHRTRQPKRADTQDAEPAGAGQCIAFAPTVTPGTFHDPPVLLEPTPESMLFPPALDAPAAGRRAAHSKKKPEDHIPRPPNAFILFRSSFIKGRHVSTDVETNHSTLSKIIGMTWQKLSPQEKEVWHARAKQALEEHKRKFPEYAFRPLHAKGSKSTEKRKVREVGPKDSTRCEAIAAFLATGKKGAELEAAVAEFDKTHKPVIETRFEAPITARHYRRSSSAPVPDTEHAQAKNKFLQTPVRSASKKPRAMSSQPDAPTKAEPQSPCPTEFFSEDSPLSSPFPASLSDSDPSFDFSTFTFEASSPTPMQHCDPLHIQPQQAAYDAFDMYSPDSSLPCSPCTPSPIHGSNVFAPLNMNYEPSLFEYNSPLSSLPSTPCDEQTLSLALPHSAPRIAPSLDDFQSNFDFFDMQPYENNMCAPVPMSHMAPTFSLAGKDEFSCYEAHELAPFEGGLSPPWTAAVPTSYAA